MLLYLVLLLVAIWRLWLIGAIIAIQFLFNLLTGRPNKQLLTFSDSLGQYIHQLISYLTYLSEDKPFPFGAWPKARYDEKTSNHVVNP